MFADLLNLRFQIQKDIGIMVIISTFEMSIARFK